LGAKLDWLIAFGAPEVTIGIRNEGTNSFLRSTAIAIGLQQN
jgi:hypothetical protein